MVKISGEHATAGETYKFEGTGEFDQITGAVNWKADVHWLTETGGKLTVKLFGQVLGVEIGSLTKNAMLDGVIAAIEEKFGPGATVHS